MTTAATKTGAEATAPETAVEYAHNWGGARKWAQALGMSGAEYDQLRQKCKGEIDAVMASLRGKANDKTTADGAEKPKRESVKRPGKNALAAEMKAAREQGATEETGVPVILDGEQIGVIETTPDPDADHDAELVAMAEAAEGGDGFSYDVEELKRRVAEAAAASDSVEQVMVKAVEAAQAFGDEMGVPIYFNDVRVAGPARDGDSDGDSDGGDAIVSAPDPSKLFDMPDADTAPLKLAVDSAALADAVRTATQATPGRTSLPILEHMLVKANHGRRTLSVMATNLEVGVVAEVPLAQVNRDGAFTWPAKLAAQLVAGIGKKDQIALTAEPGADPISKLQYGGGASKRSSATLRGMDPSEYPTWHDLDNLDDDGVPSLVLPAGVLQALAAVSVAAATSDSRPVFCGVNVEFTKGEIHAVAADSFRLAMQTVACDVPDALLGQKVLIPAPSLTLAAKTLSSELPVLLALLAPGNTETGFTPQQVALQSGVVGARVTVVSNLIAGVFPNWRAIEDSLPEAADYTAVVVAAKELESATKRAILLQPDHKESPIVGYRASTDEQGAGWLTVEMHGESEVGNGGSDVEAVAAGPDASTILNGKYVQGAVKVLTTSEVEIRIPAPERPVLFRAARGVVSGDQEGKPTAAQAMQLAGFRYIAMPMHSTAARKKAEHDADTSYRAKPEAARADYEREHDAEYGEKA